jgi:NAD+--asparagine ADP-ribosyltransferase
METIKSWWKQIDAKSIWTYEQSTSAVCAFMVKKRLASDKEQAAKIIFN